MSLALATVSKEQLHDVASIHARAFPHSALVKLGLEAVRRYYDWQLYGPHEHYFMGGFKNGRLLGYAVGGVSRRAMGGFVQKNMFFLGGMVLARPWRFVGGPAARKCGVAIRILCSSFLKKVSAVPSSTSSAFGVLAIAVDPVFQGNGVGQVLMEELESIARAKNFHRMFLSVVVTNKQAIAFYERLGWAKVPSGTVWRGKMEKELLVHPLRASTTERG